MYHTADAGSIYMPGDCWINENITQEAPGEKLPSIVAPGQLFQEVQRMETPGRREPANDNVVKMQYVPPKTPAAESY